MRNIGIILVGHGSELSSYKETIEKLGTIIRQRSVFRIVGCGFMEKNSPSIEDAVSSAVEEGVEKLVVVPVLLAQSQHTTEDIPRILGMPSGQTERTFLGKEGDKVEIIYCKPIGADARLADIILDRAAEALGDSEGGGRELRNDAGENVFENSMTIIRQLLAKDLEKMPRPLVPIVERVVHATADPEFARLLNFSKDAVEVGIRVLKNGADVITDVKMVESGINGQAVRALGGRVLTYVDDERTIRMADNLGITRTAASMLVAAEEGLDGDIVVIGNSPTATLTFVDAVRRNHVKPALVIATPVGFVMAKESKDEVAKLPIPFITVSGVKGGSAVAVSILNALLSMIH